MRRAMKKSQKKKAKQAAEQTPAFGMRHVFSILAIVLLAVGIGCCMMYAAAG